MELLNSDARMTETLTLIMSKLRPFMNRQFNKYNVEAMENIVKDISSSFKLQYGYKFPPLAIFVLPTIKFVVFYRRDLNDIEIQRKLVMLIRQLSERGITIDTNEFAQAIKNVWPHYQPPINLLEA